MRAFLLSLVALFTRRSTSVNGITADIQAKVDEIMARNRLAFGGFTMKLSPMQERSAALGAEIDALIAAAIPEDADEARSANDAIQAKITERATIDERLRVDAEQESRRKADADVRAKLGLDTGDDGQRVQVLSEPHVYDDTRSSYFLDLTRDALGRGDGDGGVTAARARLARHQRELDVDLPAREARRDEMAREQSGRELRGSGIKRRHTETMFEKRVNPNRTDGQGGFFVPPSWLIDEYIDLPRFGRTTANLCKTMALPSGTDSINLPKVATGTTVAAQADAGGVSSTDLTDTSVSAAVTTTAGQQDIAIQLLDQSPISFDEVVFADLIADYNAKLDAGCVTSILAVAGINAITYTDATPTLPELWPALLQSVSQIAKNRKMPAQASVMTPSMWYWALSQLDSSNRPLILANPGAFNAMAEGNGLDVDGPAGMFTFGLPAFLDGNIASNLGAGNNESRIISARWDDLFLWEGSMRTRVLQEVLSGTLQVRLQVYNYPAFMPNRRPSSISVISGTGLIPTAGF
jgi:hypothetical protein